MLLCGGICLIYQECNVAAIEVATDVFTFCIAPQQGVQDNGVIQGGKVKRFAGSRAADSLVAFSWPQGLWLAGGQGIKMDNGIQRCAAHNNNRIRHGVLICNGKRLT